MAEEPNPAIAEFGRAERGRRIHFTVIKTLYLTDHNYKACIRV
jgi:hypothetical protein